MSNLSISAKKHKTEHNNQYNKANYDRITIQLKKADMLYSRLESLCILTGKTENVLIVNAIEMLLDKYEL